MTMIDSDSFALPRSFKAHCLAVIATHRHNYLGPICYYEHAIPLACLTCFLFPHWDRSYTPGTASCSAMVAPLCGGLHGISRCQDLQYGMHSARNSGRSLIWFSPTMTLMTIDNVMNIARVRYRSTSPSNYCGPATYMYAITQSLLSHYSVCPLIMRPSPRRPHYALQPVRPSLRLPCADR